MSNNEASVPNEKPFSISNMTPAEKEEFARSIREAQVAAEEERERKIRNARKDISVFAGQCRCGGKLTLKSTVQFIQTGEPRYGGPVSGYNKETLKVSCAKCPGSFDAHHVMFRAHRYRISRIRRGF